MLRFQHNDMADLESSSSASPRSRLLIVKDGVSPWAAIRQPAGDLRLAKQYGERVR
jgi:7-keto-8-aminopelargonate synthetase-like enzyme